jgi:hypothetical protein
MPFHSTIHSGEYAEMEESAGFPQEIRLAKLTILAVFQVLPSRALISLAVPLPSGAEMS